MGAGPAMDERPRGEDKKDLGWLGSIAVSVVLTLLLLFLFKVF